MIISMHMHALCTIPANHTGSAGPVREHHFSCRRLWDPTLLGHAQAVFRHMYVKRDTKYVWRCYRHSINGEVVVFTRSVRKQPGISNGPLPMLCSAGRKTTIGENVHNLASVDSQLPEGSVSRATYVSIFITTKGKKKTKEKVGKGKTSKELQKVSYHLHEDPRKSSRRLFPLRHPIQRSVVMIHLRPHIPIPPFPFHIMPICPAQFHTHIVTH
jgi:hypothetical protein